MKKNKNLPSKEFWSLYVIVLFIMIFIGLKNGVDINLPYIILLPILNFFITYCVIIAHVLISAILDEFRRIL